MSAELDAAVLRWFNDLASQGVFVTDVELRIQRWNRWLEVQTGLPAAQLLGRPLAEVWPELQGRGLVNYYAAALRGQISVIAQALHGHLLPMRARPGNRAVSHMPQTARIAPLTEGGRVVGTITIIDDVTERTVREAELRNQIEALEVAHAKSEAALRAKDEFLATLSHELRTPLTAVLGWTRILRTRAVSPHELDNALEIIERNTTSQARLIDDLLDTSRILSGKLRLDVRSVDLATVVAAAVDVVAPAAAAKRVDIGLQLEADLPRFMGDPDRLQQVVWNLVSNAVKFTPAGGTVDVALARADDASVVISVRDTGEGVSRDFLPHVFERFRQADASTSRRHGGLGLGLALVRQLVELHGGSAHAESAGPGLGATFSVRLPLGRTSLEASPGAAHGVRALSVPLEDATVLVVDDDADTREMLRVLLSTLGAQVLLAGSCEEARAVLAGSRREELPQVIVTDLAMPGEDGYSLLQHLQKDPATAGIPAIALTAYATTEDRTRVMAAGFAGYVPKPVDLDALVATLSAAVDGGQRRAAQRR